jgi:Helix-turn-helix domain
MNQTQTNQVPQMVVIPFEQFFDKMKGMLDDYFQQFSEKSKEVDTHLPTHLSAREFMDLTKMSRSRMDRLISKNLIKSLKKGRTLYIPASEVERFFTDPTIK